MRIRKMDIATAIIFVLLLIILPISSCKSEQAVLSLDSTSIKGVPSFTSDGSKMVYIDQTEGYINLQSISDGRIIRFKFPAPVYKPRISPDGNNIYYTQLRSYYCEIWKINVSTMDKVNLTTVLHGDANDYCLSSDGRWLAFLSLHDSKEGLQYTPFLINLASGEVSIVKGNLPSLTIDSKILFTPDSKLALVLTRDRVLVIDTATSSLSKCINTDTAMHFPSADDNSVLFSSLKDNYYQIFSISLETGELKQLTFGATNKILPIMNKDNHLYYLDVGEKLDFHKLTRLLWLMSPNSTLCYKYYRNDWGMLNANEAPYLDFLITAYKVFHDDFFLTELAEHMESLINNMDCKSDIRDYRGESNCGWSATRYSLNKTARMQYLLHDAMIGTPMAEFVKVCQNQPGLSARMHELAQKTTEVLKQLAYKNNSEWVEHDADSLAITEDGEGYYITQKGSPEPVDGVNIPFNMQNKFGTLSVSLYEITGDTIYLEKALALGKVFRRHLIPEGDGYKWYYAWGKLYSGWSKSEGVSLNAPSHSGMQNLDPKQYATMELEFVSRLRPYGVFSESDMQKLVNTYLNPNASIKFRQGKAGAMLYPYSDKIARYMQQVDILDEPWVYLPYVAVALGNQGEDLWTLQEVCGTRQTKILSSKTLLYFGQAGNQIFCLSTEPK